MKRQLLLFSFLAMLSVNSILAQSIQMTDDGACYTISVQTYNYSSSDGGSPARNIYTGTSVNGNVPMRVIWSSTNNEWEMQTFVSGSWVRDYYNSTSYDYATMRRIIRNLLTQIGLTDIDEAGDGVSALQKLRENKFGLVISDWNMEPMTGLQFLKEVRADSKLKSTPFIMVTAESKTENVIEARAAGVNNYIVKPFNADTLKQKIESVLGPLSY